MPGRREHGDGAEPSSYVLLLREHEDAGRGYALELAPLLGGDGGSPPRADHGRGWTTEAPTAAASRAHAGSPREAATTAAGAETASRTHAYGSSRAREAAEGTSAASPTREAAATGTGSRAHAHGSSRAREAANGTGAASPTSQAATGTGAGMGSRAHAHGISPMRKVAAARLSRARGRGSAVEVRRGRPRAHGGRTDGGAASSGRGDGNDGEYDPAAPAREAILQEMRDMIFSTPDMRRMITREEQFDTESGNSDNFKIGDVLIPVFLSPKKDKEDDDIWDKRQIMYIFVLTTTAGLVFLLQPLLPVAFGRWIIMLIAVAWGAGSIGLPCGLHGTARCEKECSRHVGRFIYTLFSVLMIYGFYLAAMRISDTPAPTPALSLMGGDHESADSIGEFWWSLCRNASLHIQATAGLIEAF